jgi:hypothetical protein
VKRVGYWIAAWLPLVLYMTSMIVPVIGPVTKWGDLHLGHEVFRAGFRNVFVVDGEGWWDREVATLQATWFANPAMWVAFVCLPLGWRGGAIGAAGIGSFLCLGILTTPLRSVLEYPGYWLWWGSAAMALVVALFVLPGRPQPGADDYRPHRCSVR